ncbi:MAG: hypothetical protein J5I93_09605 [Pirellulaceae bacterium]|nr:hypothetical protein [Pirellulaceae bacterium]
MKASKRACHSGSSTGTNKAADSNQGDETSDAIRPADADSSGAETTTSNASSHARSRLFPDGQRRRRASDSPILDMPMSEYVRILLGRSRDRRVKGSETAERRSADRPAMTCAGRHEDHRRD